MRTPPSPGKGQSLQNVSATHANTPLFTPPAPNDGTGLLQWPTRWVVWTFYLDKVHTTRCSKEARRGFCAGEPMTPDRHIACVHRGKRRSP